MNEKLLYSIDILLFIIYWNGDMTGLPQAKNKKNIELCIQGNIIVSPLHKYLCILYEVVLIILFFITQ